MSGLVTSALPAGAESPTVVREEPHGEDMRATILTKFGGLDSLVHADIPKPLPKEGEVVIQVKAFGLNHAELYMRLGVWDKASEVSGIECVGIVDSCPGGEFPGAPKWPASSGAWAATSTAATPNTPASR